LLTSQHFQRTGINLYNNTRTASRTKLQLSQEEVAEKLNITRQTLSNWENNKSYPDILNIIELSNIYPISIDELIKEDKQMVESLEESLNVVKSKHKILKQILIGTYLIIWVLTLLIFWSFVNSSDIFEYGIIVFYLVLPVITFVCSIFIGKDIFWSDKKVIMPVFFGLMYMLAEYATFSLSNMLFFNKFNLPEFGLAFVGGIISYIGVIIGTIYSKLKKRRL